MVTEFESVTQTNKITYLLSLFQLDKTASTNFLGWVVASYSVGQFVASPLFGFWSNFRSKTREPIIVSLVINVLANVLYMYLESIELKPKIFLLVARVLIGFGAGKSVL